MFLCAVGPLVIFHELGHYWVGRWCGVRAQAFSIGFGTELFAWVDKRGTRWRVAALPLGGYVRFAGEYELDGSPAAHQPFDGFETAKLWERALIIVAGPAANFLIAFLALCALLVATGEPVIRNGLPITSPVIASVEPDSPAQLAGFKSGDRIVAVDGHATNDFPAIRALVVARPNQAMQFVVRRNAQVLRLGVTPNVLPAFAGQPAKPAQGHLGIVPVIVTQPIPAYEIPGRAARDVVVEIATIGMVFGKLFTGQIALTTLSGPIQTAHVVGQIASNGPIDFLAVAIFISINLGFMNLLPIPVLDGGHLALYGIEAVRRRPLSPRAREQVSRVGLVALMTLFVFVTINDLGSVGVWHALAGLIG